MVSSTLHDALNNPTAALEQLRSNSSHEDNFPALVSQYFSTLFEPSDAFIEIPTLDIHNPPESHGSRSLVRFRAMIQDTSPSPEMYLPNGGWGIETSQEVNYSNLHECHVLWGVSIPGESPWVASQLAGPQRNRVSAPNTHTPPYPHKFVSPNVAHIGAQIKIYDSGELLKPTDIVTFVGFLTFEPSYLTLESDDPVIVPTLHALYFQNQPRTIIPRVYPMYSGMGTIREELIDWIAAEGLAGDRVAAEYVLLQLVARVHSRTPPILPPTLSLARFPSSNEPPTLCSVLSHLVPFATTVPLSLETINTNSFIPESKEEDLHSGWLQLPKGSVVILTESGIKEGTVTEAGLRNLKGIDDMMRSQTLHYVFPFSSFSFNTDATFITICEGRKSAFFESTIVVPLNPVLPSESLYKPASDISLPSDDKLKTFRALIGGAQIGNATVSSEASEYIQNDFVQERKAATDPRQAVTSDDLIQRMMTARLLALSLHEKEVTPEIWDKVKKLEQQRQERQS